MAMAHEPLPTTGTSAVPTSAPAERVEPTRKPLIGALSDRSWSERWGRRKLFFVTGALGCSICLFLFPFVSALWMAVLLLWLLDASNNTAMEPYRAFIADRLASPQLATGFLTQSFFTGFGITLANVSLFVFQTLITGGTSA